MAAKYCKMIVALVAMIFTSPSAFANDSCNINAERTAFVFANGMFNLPVEAYQSMSDLRKRMYDNGTLAKIAKDPDTVTFTNVYNESEDIFTQLSEVAGQKLEDLAVYVRKVLFHAFINAKSEPVRTLEINNKTIDIEPYYVDENKFDDKDLERHVQKYRDLIRSGHRIIAVSHSQGNFYANAAFRALNATEQVSFRQVQIATPTSYIADGSRRFTTFSNDLIIKFVPLTMGPKTLVGRIIPDPSAHTFSGAYMKTDLARYEIMKHIVEAAQASKFPNSEALTPFSATLTWENPSADLDLHVFEPSGLHVYQKAKVGKSGKLVISSTDATTQELYLGNCSSMLAGTFQLAVGNFKGNDIESGTLRITAGSESHIVDFVIEASDEHPKGPVSVKKPHKVTTVKINAAEGGTPVVDFVDHL